MKPEFRGSGYKGQFRRISLLGFAFAALSLQASFAQLYYDTNGSTGGTATSSSENFTSSVWTTDSTGSSATTGYTAGSDIVFSASNGTNIGSGAQNVTVNDAESANSITFDNGIVTLFGSGAPSLSIGAGGITVKSTDGDTTLDSSLGTVTLSADQSWNNDSTKALTVNSGVTSSGATLTFAGTGSGNVNLNGVVSGSLNISADSATTAVYLNNGGNSFSGTLMADGGTLIASYSSALGNSGNAIDLNNGGLLEIANGGTSFNNTITLGTGGGSIDASLAENANGDTGYGGVMTGTSMTLIGGDFITTAGNASDIGTINITGGRLLAYGNGIFGNNAAINVESGGTLDFAVGGIGNAITLEDGSALETRSGGYTTISDVTFTPTGTVTLGADDVGGSYLNITSNIDLTGSLTLDIKSGGNPTTVNLAGTISGSGALILQPYGASSSTPLQITGSNNYDGPTTINNLTVAPGTQAFGSSIVTLNNATINLVGGYGVTANTNEFVLGSDTNLFAGVGSTNSFSGSVVNGTGSVLHLTGQNNTIDPVASAVSNYSTLDIDSGRTFLYGSNGLNFIANGTTVNVAAGAVLDFATSTTATVDNQINFASGSGLVMRGDFGPTNIILTNAALPTEGSFAVGSDDESGHPGSFIIEDGVGLTNDLDLHVIGNSYVPVYITGNISGTGGLTQDSGGNGAGTLILLGTNSYSGSTTINVGTMILEGDNTGTGNLYAVESGILQIGAYDNSGALPSTANVVLGSGSTSGQLVLGENDAFATGGVTQTVASLTTSGTGTANSVVNGGGTSNASALVIDNNTDDVFSGTIGGAGSGQNNLFVEKDGSGTLTLSGVNTYAEGTLVTAGKLAVDGSIVGDVAVEYGAEVGGHGSIGGTISGGGSVGPGNSPGILTAASVDPSGGLSFNFEFILTGAPDYGAPAASGNDVLHLEGAAPFVFALTSSNDINLYFSGVGAFEGGFFVNGADSLTANVADATYAYYILDNTNGTFFYNGNLYDLTTGTASIVAVSGAAFGDGAVNGYAMRFAVPEPSSDAMILGGLAFLGLWMRRKRAPFQA